MIEEQIWGHSDAILLFISSPSFSNWWGESMMLYWHGHSDRQWHWRFLIKTDRRTSSSPLGQIPPHPHSSDQLMRWMWHQGAPSLLLHQYWITLLYQGWYHVLEVSGRHHRNKQEALATDNNIIRSTLQGVCNTHSISTIISFQIYITDQNMWCQIWKGDVCTITVCVAHSL